MGFDPELAELRFGTGLGPRVTPARDIATMLERLQGPDLAARHFPIASFVEQIPDIIRFGELRKAGRRGDATAKEQADRIKRGTRIRQGQWFAATLARWVDSPDGMRERLTRFWADHFTVAGKQTMTRPLVSTYVEDAIRPHVTGRFADMLRAAETHQMMLDYLDQFKSVGEGSRVARNDPAKGLNENLAREILELHTLGVDGPYDQKDVRQFANLLAGFTHDRRGTVNYQKRRANPGPEVIMGKSYGGQKPRVEDVYEAFEDLATHPATARHLAQKLAVHFVTDDPDPALVDHVAARYLATGGDLMEVYAALLEHPAAWAPERRKVKQPFDFVATSVKALGVSGQQAARLKLKDLRQGFLVPMALMGETWQKPTGPDGLPEEASFWITPQGLAARIEWALTIPLALFERIPGDMPDPRDLVAMALGRHADDNVRFVAGAAETRWEGVGLVLSSPAFQRR